MKIKSASIVWDKKHHSWALTLKMRNGDENWTHREKLGDAIAVMKEWLDEIDPIHIEVKR